jgi:hypothetical protein
MDGAPERLGDEREQATAKADSFASLRNDKQNKLRNDKQKDRQRQNQRQKQIPLYVSL